MPEFLHDRKDFGDLIAVVADERSLDPTLVEKDYWIMHCLWGLGANGFKFELKGGTSLSKGFGVIHRFSEDIDICIQPPRGLGVKFGRNQDKSAHVVSRRAFYDWVATEIKIPGIVQVTRDEDFDDDKMRSGGIRLSYAARTVPLAGVKDGVLLELGFDDTAPNRPVTISSWAWDTASSRGISFMDNRAINVPCYAPTHTFVEKLQTISTKYRKLGDSQAFPANFLRHYYDVYCLLHLEEIQLFMQEPAYQTRKKQRFRMGDELVIANNLAFTLPNMNERKRFATEYRKTQALYYQGQPDFEALMARIEANIASM